MKRNMITVCEVISLISGIVAIKLLTAPFLNLKLTSWIFYVIWIIGLSLINRHVTNVRINHLKRLWYLADKLAYSAETLKKMANNKYGILDWKLSRPENLQFFPNDKLVTNLIHELTLQLTNQTERN